MINARKLPAYALSAVLLVGGAGAAFAQSTSGGNTTAGGNTATSATTEGSGQGMNRAGGDDNSFDWGWLGLLGLIGLAGLMRRDAHNTHRHAGMGTASRT